MPRYKRGIRIGLDTKEIPRTLAIAGTAAAAGTAAGALTKLGTSTEAAPRMKKFAVGPAGTPISYPFTSGEKRGFVIKETTKGAALGGLTAGATKIAGRTTSRLKRETKVGLEKPTAQRIARVGAGITGGIAGRFIGRSIGMRVGSLIGGVAGGPAGAAAGALLGSAALGTLGSLITVQNTVSPGPRTQAKNKVMASDVKSTSEKSTSSERRKSRTETTKKATAKKEEAKKSQRAKAQEKPKGGGDIIVKAHTRGGERVEEYRRKRSSR